MIILLLFLAASPSKSDSSLTNGSCGGEGSAAW